MFKQLVSSGFVGKRILNFELELKKRKKEEKKRNGEKKNYVERKNFKDRKICYCFINYRSMYNLYYL